jgi:acetyl-CoA carboxylase biotin carboxyl carrier protein
MAMKKIERRVGRPGSARKGPIQSKAADPILTGTGAGEGQEDVKVSSPLSDQLSLAEIRELIELISEKQFNEFELERGDFRLRLQKGFLQTGRDGVGSQEIHPPDSPPPSSATHPSFAVPTTVASAPTPSATSLEEESLHIVTSPIVGTFYRSPSPTSSVFVQVGDVVEIGRTICIIEAMKLMNEIQSDARGTVMRIFVENGQPVEYGQPLFGLKP